MQGSIRPSSSSKFRVTQYSRKSNTPYNKNDVIENPKNNSSIFKKQRGSIILKNINPESNQF
jgi:hypothetical protein